MLTSGCRPWFKNVACLSSLLAATTATATATATKTSLQNERLRNGDYSVIIASSSHPLLLTEHAEKGLVEAPLK